MAMLEISPGIQGETKRHARFTRSISIRRVRETRPALRAWARIGDRMGGGRWSWAVVEVAARTIRGKSVRINNLLWGESHARPIHHDERAAEFLAHD